MDISIAEPEDAEGVYNVRKLTWIDTYPNEAYGISKTDIENLFTEDAKAQEVARYKNLYNDIKDGKIIDRNIWIAKVDKKVVGFCMFVKEGTSSRLKSIYLLPEHQHKGIGTMLIKQGLEWVKDSNLVLVNVAKYNTDTIKFYEKQGFKYTKEILDDKAGKLPNGKVIPEIEMQR